MANATASSISASRVVVISCTPWDGSTPSFSKRGVVFPSPGGWWLLEPEEPSSRTQELWRESEGEFHRAGYVSRTHVEPGAQYLAVTSDGAAAIGIWDGLVVHDTRTNRERACVPLVAGGIDRDSLALSNDGSKVAGSGSYRGTVYLLDLPRLQSALERYGFRW